MRWAVGVTTVPERRGDLLPRTLASLSRAGFPEPRLFVDGDHDHHGWQAEFLLDVTCRYPRLRTVGNWVLALWELMVRHPDAERYLVAQDDCVFSRNVRPYLERTATHERAYHNLYTFPSNQRLAPAGGGWFEAATLDGKPGTFQTGRGAVCLVFSREAVVTLLSARSLVEKPLDPHRGWRSVDGAVVTAFNRAGWREFVHSPSLCQHTGLLSSMDKRQGSSGKDAQFPPYRWPSDTLAASFRGEDWDALSLLRTADEKAKEAAKEGAK